jgi:hypothetical protein
MQKMKKATQNFLKTLLGSTIIAALIEPLAEKAQEFFQNALNDAKGATLGFTRELLEMIAVAVLGFVGILFMLFGLALFLEERVGVPGAGPGYVGTGLVFFALVTILVMRYHNHRNK